MSISERKHISEPDVVPMRRIEVFAGAGRRRTWGADQKAAIVAESFAEGASVCEVAGRHGLTPQQLFTWRRRARKETEAREDAGPPPFFVPAIAENVGATVRTPAPAPKSEAAAPVVEIEMGEAHVWIWRDADIGMATAILRALRTPSGPK